jgi:hypothetical protein
LALTSGAPVLKSTAEMVTMATEAAPVFGAGPVDGAIENDAAGLASEGGTMNLPAFSTLIRSWKTGSRRDSWRVLMACAVGGMLVTFNPDDTGAKRKKRTKRKKRSSRRRCLPDCADNSCGDDHCGGTCGSACVDGHVCQGGICVCPPGQQESGGVCGTPPTCKRVETQCDDPRDCCSGVCDIDTFNECLLCSDTGMPCHQSDDCCPSLNCRGFVCQAP